MRSRPESSHGIPRVFRGLDDNVVVTNRDPEEIQREAEALKEGAEESLDTIDKLLEDLEAQPPLTRTTEPANPDNKAGRNSEPEDIPLVVSPETQGYIDSLPPGTLNEFAAFALASRTETS